MRHLCEKKQEAPARFRGPRGVWPRGAESEMDFFFVSALRLCQRRRPESIPTSRVGAAPEGEIEGPRLRAGARMELILPVRCCEELFFGFFLECLRVSTNVFSGPFEGPISGFRQFLNALTDRTPQTTK